MYLSIPRWVVIRFQICIFDILNTAPDSRTIIRKLVVIRFQICIFDILNTAQCIKYRIGHEL